MQSYLSRPFYLCQSLIGTRVEKEHSCFLISLAEKKKKTTKLRVVKLWSPTGSDWINQVEISSKGLILVSY